MVVSLLLLLQADTGAMASDLLSSRAGLSIVTLLFWDTPAGLTWALGTVSVVALLIAAWGVLLNSQVRKQTRLLSQQLERSRQAEEALKESQNFLQQAQAVAHLGSWISDLSGSGKLTWSSQTCRIFGLDEAAFDGRVKTFYSHVHPDDRDRVEALSRQAIAEGAPYDIDHRILRPDGTIRWVHERAEVLRDAEGKPNRLIGVVQDITERKETEEALLRIRQDLEERVRQRTSELEQAHHLLEQKVEERTAQFMVANAALQEEITERQKALKDLRLFRCLLDQSNDAIFMANLEGRLLDANQTACSMLGYSREELLQRRISDICVSTPEVDLTELRRELHETTCLMIETLQRRKDGSTFPVEAGVKLVRCEQGEFLVSVVRDITEKRQLQAQFLRAQRLESLGTLAGGIAHDLNNVLAPILMSNVLFRTKLPAPEDQELLDRIEAGAQRGAAMIRQLLSFARGNEGERKVIQVQEVIEEMAKIGRNTFSRLIEVRTDVQPDLWPIKGDSTQVQQILMNLCVNARDAMPEGGFLTIKAENRMLSEADVRTKLGLKAGPCIVLSVTDTGTGIPEELQSKIFDPFFTTKESGKGTGLGLATVLGLVKSHGGFLDLKSEVGKGSEFSIYFPAEPSAAFSGTADSDDEASEGKGELVLIVEDEKAIRETTRAVLSRRGYRVLTATNGKEALALFCEHSNEVQLVITDNSMPVLDGPSTIRAMLALNPQVKIIMFSGYMDPEKLSNLPGSVRFLQKPCTPNRLLAVMREVLAMPSASS